MMQIYDRNMNQDHALKKTCRIELDVVFFGPIAERTKETRVADGKTVAARLISWYEKWASVDGVFRASMEAKHRLQLEHVRLGCVSDPPAGLVPVRARLVPAWLGPTSESVCDRGRCLMRLLRADPLCLPLQMMHQLEDGTQKTVRSTSQLERFFREANRVFQGGPVSSLTADLALADLCLQHNVRFALRVVAALMSLTIMRARLLSFVARRSAVPARTASGSTARTTCLCSPTVLERCVHSLSLLSLETHARAPCLFRILLALARSWLRRRCVMQARSVSCAYQDPHAAAALFGDVAADFAEPAECRSLGFFGARDASCARDRLGVVRTPAADSAAVDSAIAAAQ